MASGKPKVYHCRFCRSLTRQNQVVSLFTNKAVQKGWVTRISRLLEIPVEKKENISPYMRDKCTTKLESLEKAVKDFAAFKAMARCSLEITGGLSHTQTRETSSSIRVSPDMARVRPLAKRRLDFNSYRPNSTRHV